MRNSIRRLSLALRLSKPLDMIAATSDASGLAQFLSASKEKYLSDIRAMPSRGGEWTVVMGNEAGDLDSLASSIGFAWLQSEVHKKPTIPLLQVERDDLDLRAENTYALKQAGIDKPKDQLLFLTDLAGLSPFPSQNFALVDHNRLGATYTLSNPSAQVLSVIDHHDDEGLYTTTANPRTIAPCGSCASHIASLLPPEVPSALATLLLSAILIDTNGLKPGGKALAPDTYAAGFLVPRSTLAPSLPPKLVSTLRDDPKARPEALHEAPSIREFTATLVGKKGDVSHLSGRDLLRRDYKDYSYSPEWLGGREVKAGLASVPLPLKAWGKDGAFEAAAIPWMKERGLAVLGVLTSFRDGSRRGKSGKGKHKREMAWVVYDGPAKEVGAAEGVQGIDVEKVAAKLWNGLEESAELRLKKHKKVDLEKAGKLPTGAKAHVYRQGNVDATRKVTAPLLKNILEAPEPAGK